MENRLAELRAAYWDEQLRDAQMAEQISKFTAEERKSWNDHLAQLRKQAIDALYAISKFSCMLWEQMSEGEEFELNPESYWRKIIADARVEEQRIKAAAALPPQGEVDAPPPLPTPTEADEEDAPPPLPEAAWPMTLKE